ncbi:MAG TPA: hypothetical protein VF791_24805 [Pyrinomonadaceae bacterium]
MKSENLLLYGVCVVMALLFLGLAGLNYFSAGNFISTDSLFFTTVSGMMAFIFLLIPLASMRADKKATKAAEAAGGAAAAAALPGRGGAAALRPGTTIPAGQMMRDAKGRPVPPDVRKMVEQMKETEKP